VKLHHQSSGGWITIGGLLCNDFGGEPQFRGEAEKKKREDGR